MKKMRVYAIYNTVLEEYSPPMVFTSDAHAYRVLSSTIKAFLKDDPTASESDYMLCKYPGMDYNRDTGVFAIEDTLTLVKPVAMDYNVGRSADDITEVG